VTLQVQFVSLLWMIGSGIVMGVVFDIYRVLQQKLRLHRWLTSVFDLLYWLAATAFVFLGLLSSNDGQLRLYVFLALIVGLWFYFIKWSSLTIRIVLWFIHIIELTVRWLLVLFDALIVRPLWFILVLASWIGHIGMTIVYYLGKTVFTLLSPLFYLLRPLHSLLKWMGKPIVQRLSPILRTLKQLYQKSLKWLRS
jgi:spore cortex biosynthesis protein YabQ